MATPSSKSSILGIAAAFIIGSLLFVGVFRATGVFNRGNSGTPLLPPDKRAAPASLDMPLLAATAPVTTAPAIWRLSDQRGKVVFVNYFATWCPPCMAEVPDLVALKKAYEPRGVVFAAVSLDQDDPKLPRESVLRDFVGQQKFSLPILLPPPSDPLWRTSFPIPQSFLYDKQGRLARSILGGIDGQYVEKSLDQLLKE
jgi:thiol-disulfide isomerase/thioredoxin